MPDPEVPDADALEQDALPEREPALEVRPSASPEAPEADALEQATAVDAEVSLPTGPKDPEAPEADWLEQSLTEPDPDDDER